VASFGDAEPLATQPPSLVGAGSMAYRRGGMAMGLAGDPPDRRSQISAGDVECRVHIEILAVSPQVAEGDPLGVTEEPGGLVIRRLDPLLHV